MASRGEREEIRSDLPRVCEALGFQNCTYVRLSGPRSEHLEPANYRFQQREENIDHDEGDMTLNEIELPSGRKMG